MHPRLNNENLDMLEILGPVRKAMFVYTNYISRRDCYDPTANRLRAELADTIAGAHEAIQIKGCG